MHKHLFGPCDEIDACLFSGDLMEDLRERAEFQKMLDRWQKKLTEMNSSCPDCGGSLVAGEYGTDRGLLAQRYTCGAVVHVCGEFQIACPAVGETAGERCNRGMCPGTIQERPVENCSCHLGHPPCGACTNPSEHCDTCDWEAE